MKIKTKNAPLEINKIEEFEENYGFIIPTEFRNFLLENNGIYFKPMLFDLEVQNEIITFCTNSIYSINNNKDFDIEWIRNLTEENIEQNGFYINDSDCFIFIAPEYDNEIYLGIKGKYYGKVYLVDKVNVDGLETKLHLIANNFSEFLNMLRESDIEPYDENEVFD
ncbi:SMI1/KNR4 family protein [Emticicia sp. W12TSBA100-4]|uniref:SMI1/KNR4 family protein n=1 Tax=Emticicia sp. W12TSBA100-4 TaxID=3160965 RepID=UPI003305B649